MAAKPGSRKKSEGARNTVDADQKDRRIADLENRIITLENELRSKQKAPLIPDTTEPGRAKEALQESEARLAADMAAMKSLQKLSTRFMQEGDLDALLGEIMEAAVAIAGADRGTLQLIRQGHLDIVAQHGFEQSYVDFFSSVSHGTAAVCATALGCGERVIVEDVEESPIFIGTPALDVQRKAGVRAVQSTPLVNRRGEMIGMMSTHWCRPHRPDEHVLRYIDLLARQAADIIERKLTEEKMAHVASFPELNPNPLFEVDEAGAILYSNPATKKLFPDLQTRGRDHPVLKGISVDDFHRNGNSEQATEVQLNNKVYQQSVYYLPDRNTLRIYMRDVTERRRADEALKRSEAHLKLAETVANLGHWEWDIKSGLVSWSESLYRVLGYPRGTKSSYDAWRSRLHPEDLPSVEKVINDAVREGKPYHFDYRIILPDGTIRYVNDSGNVLEKDDDGHTVTYFGTTQDITGRKKSEEALAAAHGQLQSIIDNTPDLVYALDLEERFVLANATLAELLGSAPEQMIGKRRHEFMPGEDADWHEANDRKAIEAGKALEFEERSLLDGRGITWLTKKFPLYDARGRIYGVAGISADISERKRAEEALREIEARSKVAEAIEAERQRLFDVLERLPVMVNLLTPDHHVPFGNRAYREKFGELDGRHCYDYCFGKSEPCEFCEAYGVLETGKPHHWEVNGEDGSVIDVYDYPFKDVDGSPLILEMCIDITERKRAETEVEKYRKHLEDLVKYRTRDLEDAKQQAELYLDLMGHDISNMHQIILAQLQLADEIISADGRLEGSDKELIDTSIRNLLRSAKLIDNVKSLQKLQAGEFSLTPVDLDEVLIDAVAAYSNIPDKRVSFDYTPAHGHVIKVNPVIKEVFNNLIDNAVKHSGDNVRIGITVSREKGSEDGYHRVTIEDNGPGIPDDKKEEVFHRLRRGQTKARGTGLGLYLVKTLVESFGGIVELQDRVEGDYSQGSRFNVYLPAAGGDLNGK